MTTTVQTPLPTLSGEFCEFSRKGRSLESRKIVVQGTAANVLASYLTDTNDSVAEVLIAAGAITPSGTSYIRSAGAIAMTLADAVNNGTIKRVVATVAVGTITITPVTTLGAYATVALTAAGDSVDFQWVNDGTTTGWAIIRLGTGTAAAGAFTGGVGPVIA